MVLSCATLAQIAPIVSTHSVFPLGEWDIDLRSHVNHRFSERTFDLEIVARNGTKLVRFRDLLLIPGYSISKPC